MTYYQAVAYIPRSYGIPEKLVLGIKSFCDNFTCTVGKSNFNLLVKTEVRQGCVMSAPLFDVAINWVMRQTLDDPRGVAGPSSHHWKTCTILMTFCSFVSYSPTHTRQDIPS